jgi:serine/threonine protein kinase
MIKKYTIGKKNDTEDKNDGSDYESDGGTKYTPKKVLGKGTSSRARLFTSKNNKKNKVVLDPIELSEIDEREIQNKFNFFKTLYSNQAELFRFEQKYYSDNELETINNYRMILPLVPGVPYNEVDLTDPNTQWSLLKSAVKAIKDCHKNKIIIIDIKGSNIHYDEKTGKSYLIDGGTSAKIGEAVFPEIFQQDNNEKVKEKKALYRYLPPECWSTKEVLATPKMDIYSLFYMFALLQTKQKNKHPIIENLMIICCQQQPSIRPSLDEIEGLLENEKLQQILLNLIDEYQTISLNLSKENKNTLKEYLLETLLLVLRGKDEFEKEYTKIKQPIEKIDENIGTKYEELILEALMCDNHRNFTYIEQLNDLANKIKKFALN